MSEIILQAENLKKVFVSGKKEFTAVDDVSFELERGECLGIVGESGSGKSTIAQMITHLEPATEGRIFLKEQDITHARGKALRDIYQDVQMVFRCRWNRLTQDVHWETELGKVFGTWG